MVEREQRRGRDEDEAEIAAPAAPSDGTAEIGQSKADDDASEFERAMELGRKVMSDHHAVLAALAK